jgi:hypothetical protein
MCMSRIVTSAVMSLRELARNRTMLVMAALVPVISFAVAVASTQHRDVPVRLAAAPTADLLMVSERMQSLLFLGIAAVGLMGAFFGATLVQRRVEVNRRLVLCGYRAADLMLAKLGVLLVIIMASALYALALLRLLQEVERPLGVLLGFALAAFVYGAYGLVIGSLFRRDLETIFAILLLINLDAGWLQNPIHYLHVRSPWLVESLPAHFPAQTTFLAAFTTHPLGATAAKAWLYGAAFLVIALLVYGRRMRVAR